MSENPKQKCIMWRKRGALVRNCHMLATLWGGAQADPLLQLRSSALCNALIARASGIIKTIPQIYSNSSLLSSQLLLHPGKQEWLGLAKSS